MASFSWPKFWAFFIGLDLCLKLYFDLYFDLYFEVRARRRWVNRGRSGRGPKIRFPQLGLAHPPTASHTPKNIFRVEDYSNSPDTIQQRLRFQSKDWSWGVQKLKFKSWTANGPWITLVVRGDIPTLLKAGQNNPAKKPKLYSKVQRKHEKQ